jgi:ATP phosphoribosyltransferase
VTPAPAGGQALTLALPRGRPWLGLRPLLCRAGVAGAAEADPERQLVTEAAGTRLLFTRPADVVTYVREGVADLGVTGKDVLLEDGAGVVELAELPAGTWRMSLAVRRADLPLQRLLTERGNALRVATSYPVTAAAHFAARGLTPQVIRLRGAVELAAVAGLADCIVDMVDTGRTLRDHGLVEAEVLRTITLRLVANQASHRWKAGPIGTVLARLRAAARVTDP